MSILVPPIGWKVGGGESPFPSVVNSSVYNNPFSNSATHNVTLPPSISAGNLLLMSVSALVIGSAISQPNPPAGWSLLVSNADSLAGYSYFRHTVFFKVAAGNEGGTVPVTHSPASGALAICYQLKDAGSLAYGDYATTLNPPASNAPSSPAASNVLWVPWIFAAVSGVTGAPTGYTGLITVGSSQDQIFIATATRELNAASEDPGAFSVSGTSHLSGSRTIAVGPK